MDYLPVFRELKAKGLTHRQIACELNSRGFTCKTGDSFDILDVNAIQQQQRFLEKRRRYRQYYETKLKELGK